MWAHSKACMTDRDRSRSRRCHECRRADTILFMIVYICLMKESKIEVFEYVYRCDVIKIANFANMISSRTGRYLTHETDILKMETTYTKIFFETRSMTMESQSPWSHTLYQATRSVFKGCRSFFVCKHFTFKNKAVGVVSSILSCPVRRNYRQTYWSTYKS